MNAVPQTTKKQSIFDIRDDFDALFGLIEEQEAEGGTLAPETEAILEEFKSDLAAHFEDKADNYAYIITADLGKAKVLKDEAARLNELAKSLENKAARLKGLLYFTMVVLDIRKIDTPYHKFGVQANGGLRKLEILCDPKDLPDLYVDEVTTYVPDKKALYELMEGSEAARNDLLARIEKAETDGEKEALKKSLEALDSDDLKGVVLHPRGESLRIR